MNIIVSLVSKFYTLLEGVKICEIFGQIELTPNKLLHLVSRYNARSSKCTKIGFSFKNITSGEQLLLLTYFMTPIL